MRHPGVHAEVEVAHHEDERLEPLGEVERVHRHRRSTPRPTPGCSMTCLRVAVRQQRGRTGCRPAPCASAARSTARRAGCRRRRRHFGVVREAGELAHQRDARARRRGHRARARPAGADHHAERRDLVLGLDDRERRLARLLVHAVLLHVADQRLGQRRRRRDRIPGDDGDAGHHAAERARRRCPRSGSCPAVLFIGSTPVRILLGAGARSAYVVAGLERAPC